LVLCGLAAGIPAALALSRIVTGFLYAITTTDPLTFLAVGGLLLATAALSGYVPARSASGIDPMVALRHE